MYYYHYSHIPQELLNSISSLNDVNILIGENGSGKSTMLNTLSNYYLSEKKHVIAIANSIHDKFQSRHKNFKVLRGRTGPRQAQLTMKHALQNIARTDVYVLKNAIRALQYVGFEPTIGFKINKLAEDFDSVLMQAELNQGEVREIITLINSYLHDINYKLDVFDKGVAKMQGILWLDERGMHYELYDKYNSTGLFKWEKKLKELGVIGEIEIFLQKKGQAITMLNASSGELSLITSIVYLSTVVTTNSVFLIDEPENSLHPKWQKEYVKTIMDLFFRYEPKVIIATHSPLLVNGAELFVDGTKVYKHETETGYSRFIFQKQKLLNVEEAFFKLFDIITPQNRFLSDRLARLLNVLDNKKMSLEEFFNEIDKIQSESYDEKQVNVLESIKSLAVSLSDGNQNNQNNQ
jgi:predicted ATPase